jgi:ATP-binding cassette subfamily B protein
VTEQAVFDAFRAAGENRTILTISHRLSGVLDADTVDIMAHGQIVQSGSPETLAGREG